MGNDQSRQGISDATLIADGILGGVSTVLRASGDEHCRKAARIIGTAGSSVGVLGSVVTEPDQHQRLLELIQKHNLPGLIQALAAPGGVHFEPEFFPDWVRKAGGYFPKFAQVLSVRADLIRDPAVLAGFSKCLEDMDPCSINVVRRHLQRTGWQAAACARVGANLNAGTVAQVNQYNLPDGHPAVVKVAWPATRAKMVTDFGLFRHANKILKSLDLSAATVAAMFDAVNKAEPAVLAEFDMPREARALAMARGLCSSEWPSAYQAWQRCMMQTPNIMPPLAVAWAQSASWSARVPEPFNEYTSRSVLVMSAAGGESMQKLLEGCAGQAGQQEAATVLIGYAVPLIGWLLLHKSTSHLAHVDPHPGNFRWDSSLQQLWILDWGSHVTLPEAQRRSLREVILLIANGGDDASIAEATRRFGARGSSDEELANVMRDMLNPRPSQAGQDVLNGAAVDNVFQNISDNIVPVVRCLSILGGMLQAMQEKLQNEMHVDVPVSLAMLWRPFALMA